MAVPRLTKAGLRELGKTPWGELFRTLASILTSGAAGVIGWILLGWRYESVIASPILALAAIIVLGGLYALSQWTLSVYVKEEDVGLFDAEIRHLSAGWTMYSFLFVVGAAFFVVPGVYVLARLAPYVPRVARGDDVFAGVTATWSDNGRYVQPILLQGSLYCSTGFILAAVTALLPVYAVTGLTGLTGLITQSSVAFISFSLAYIIVSLTVNSFLVGTAREIGSLDEPRAVGY